MAVYLYGFKSSLGLGPLTEPPSSSIVLGFMNCHRYNSAPPGRFIPNSYIPNSICTYALNYAFVVEPIFVINMVGYEISDCLLSNSKHVIFKLGIN